ncbi:MAG: hypothetical protein ACLP9L_06910, partial [Thermoguttaceae bacterium]
FFEGLHFQEQIPVAASTQVSAVREAEIVLFCVKTLDTEEAASTSFHVARATLGCALFRVTVPMTSAIRMVVRGS